MNKLRKALLIIKSLFRKVYVQYWKIKNSRAGNVHMPATNATLVKIPFSENHVYLRPTSSDVTRASEYISSIYYSKTYLHEALHVAKPTILIDIGANIGLSSLSLVEEFASIKKVIAIEAEEENFGVLVSNFRYWSKKFNNTVFEPIHAVATSDANLKMTKQASLAELSERNSVSGKYSASGTFRFGTNSGDASLEGDELTTISIKDLFKDFQDSETIIVKIDIEGGEEYLMNKNTEWVKATSFITMEIHDRFHPVMLNSSTNSIKALCEGNFAITPSNDVLHCYNRDKLFGR